jgi:hypothetical protein
MATEHTTILSWKHVVMRFNSKRNAFFVTFVTFAVEIENCVRYGKRRATLATAARA